MAYLEVRGLRKSFKSKGKPVDAVKDISFDVERGEMVGLLGPNGAGKTTTIKCILNLVRKDAGVVRVNGVDPSLRPREAASMMAAVLEGSRNTYWRLTVWENILFFAGIHGVPVKQNKEYFEYLLEVLGLKDRRNTEVRNLSSGYKQKTAVACALAKRTGLVFLDEPTLGLDVESSYELREALRQLQTREKRTIIISSHDMHVVQDVCSRAIIISQGRVVADDTIPNLISLFSSRRYKITISHHDDYMNLPVLAASLEKLFPGSEIEEARGALEVHVTLRTGRDIYTLMDVLRNQNAIVEHLSEEEVDLEKAFLEIVRRNGVCGERA